MLVILFSPSPLHINHIENNINFSFEYKTALSLDTNFLKDNFLRLIYAHESWWDEFRLPHLRKRFIDNQISIYAINLAKDTALNRRKFKEELRNSMSTIDSTSSRHIHIADSSNEDDCILSLIQTDCLYMWLQNAITSGNSKTNMLLKEWMCELNINPSSDQLILGGSLALYILGLLCRYPRDVDFIFTGTILSKAIPNWNLNCHNDHLTKYLGHNWKYKFSKYPVITYKNLTICHPEFLFQLKLERTIKNRSYKDIRDLFYMSFRLGKDVSIILKNLLNYNISYFKIVFAFTEAYINLSIFPSILHSKYIFKLYLNRLRKLRTRSFIDP